MIRVTPPLATALLVALIGFGAAAEWWIAPLRPGGSWLILKVLPLCFAVPGVWRGRVYTYQWSAMLVLAYFAEGVVRAASDPGAKAVCAAIELVLALLFFMAALAYSYPYKRAARAQAKAQGGKGPAGTTSGASGTKENEDG